MVYSYNEEENHGIHPCIDTNTVLTGRNVATSTAKNGIEKDNIISINKYGC